MYMPAQIQLKTVKMVEVGPESAVPVAGSWYGADGSCRCPPGSPSPNPVMCHSGRQNAESVAFGGRGGGGGGMGASVSAEMHTSTPPAANSALSLMWCGAVCGTISKAWLPKEGP